MTKLPHGYGLKLLGSIRAITELLSKEEKGLITLPDDVRPVFVGDLHGRGSHLVSILKEGNLFQDIQAGKAALIILGDAVHPSEGNLSDMDSSITLIKFIMEFKVKYPFGIYYLMGNHDPVTPLRYKDHDGAVYETPIIKGGVNQTETFRNTLEELGGAVLVNAYARYTELLPLMAEGPDFLACHGGPPRDEVSRETLVNIRTEENFDLLYQILMNRSIFPRNEGGYDSRDVIRLRKALSKPENAQLIVGHTPPPHGESVWENASGIENHTVIMSSHVSSLKAVTRESPGKFVSYPIRMYSGKPEEFLQ